MFDQRADKNRLHKLAKEKTCTDEMLLGVRNTWKTIEDDRFNLNKKYAFTLTPDGK